MELTHQEAYKLRLERNHQEFLRIASLLQALGCTVYAPKDGMISFIKVFRQGQHIVFGFAEVPYRWYLQICFKPSKEHGSGRTVKEIGGTDNPFSIDQIIAAMVPDPAVSGFSEPTYLRKL